MCCFKHAPILTYYLNLLYVLCLYVCILVLICKSVSAPARIRKGQDAEALNRALCVASQKFRYTGGGIGRG